VDIWQITNSHLDIYTPPNTLTGLEDIPHTYSIVETKTNYTSLADWSLRSFAASKYHAAYHPLFEIEQFMKELQELHPDIVKLRVIGRSFEERDLYAMTLSVPSNITFGPISKQGKLGFVISGAQHAREVRTRFHSS
jgi:extracellular matrix protein 14